MLYSIQSPYDPVKRKIFWCVGAAHLIFAIWIMTSHAIHKPKKTHKPLIVKTITPKNVSKTAIADKPRSTAIAKPAVPPQHKPAAPAPVVKPAPQPQKKAPPAVKKETVVKKETAIKKEPAIQDKTLSKTKTAPPQKKPVPQNRAKISDDLYRDLEESIAKIDAKRDKVYSKKLPATAKPVAAPLQIDALSMETGFDGNAGAATYAESLVHYLHQSLNLPEYGEVKVQLTLRQDGTVVKLVVVQTESASNRRYLETNLPKLKFPRFEGQLAKNKEHTFTLTFCNEL